MNLSTCMRLLNFVPLNKNRSVCMLFCFKHLSLRDVHFETLAFQDGIENTKKFDMENDLDVLF